MHPAHWTFPSSCDWICHALLRYLQAFDDNEDEHSLGRLTEMVSAILQMESVFLEWHLGQDWFLLSACIWSFVFSL